jgi:hypothetical protein
MKGSEDTVDADNSINPGEAFVRDPGVPGGLGAEEAAQVAGPVLVRKVEACKAGGGPSHSSPAARGSSLGPAPPGRGFPWWRRLRWPAPPLWRWQLLEDRELREN